MTENRPNSSSESASAGALLQMLSGCWVTQIVRTAVDAVSGDFVLTVDRAWLLVRTFIKVGAAGELGEWCEL
ncbi:hypothetical protein [Streptomyces sp. NPDC001070]